MGLSNLYLQRRYSMTCRDTEGHLVQGDSLMIDSRLANLGGTFDEFKKGLLRVDMT